MDASKQCTPEEKEAFQKVFNSWLHNLKAVVYELKNNPNYTQEERERMVIGIAQEGIKLYHPEGGEDGRQ